MQSCHNVDWHMIARCEMCTIECTCWCMCVCLCVGMLCYVMLWSWYTVSIYTFHTLIIVTTIHCVLAYSVQWSTTMPIIACQCITTFNIFCAYKAHSAWRATFAIFTQHSIHCTTTITTGCIDITIGANRCTLRLWWCWWPPLCYNNTR